MSVRTRQSNYSGIFIIIAVFLLALAVASGAGAALVQVTDCSNISSVGTSDVYELQNGINYTAGGGACGDIENGDVLLDCRGYAITFGGGASGLYVNAFDGGYNNITIKNCTLLKNTTADSAYGIYMGQWTTNSVIQDTNIIMNGSAGTLQAVHIEPNSDSINITNTNIIVNGSGSGVYGISISTSASNCKVIDSSVSLIGSATASRGIDIGSGLGNTFISGTNVTVASPSSYDVYAGGSDNTTMLNVILNATNSSSTEFYSGPSFGGPTTTARNLTLARASTTIDFRDGIAGSGGMILKSVNATEAPANPVGMKNITKWVKMTDNTGGGFFCGGPSCGLYLNFSYTTSDITGVNESSLRVWRRNGGIWDSNQFNSTNTVNTTLKKVIVRINFIYDPLGHGETNATSYFAPFGAAEGGGAGGLALASTIRTGGCLANETDALHLSNLTNAHAEPYNESNYGYSVCVIDASKTINISNGAQFRLLRISNTTNAHGELPSLSNYPISVWLNTSNYTYSFSCTYENVQGNCSKAYGTGKVCLFTLSNTTNAHLADCNTTADTAYNMTVCCKLSTFPPCSFGSINGNYYVDSIWGARWTNNASDPILQISCDRGLQACKWGDSPASYGSMPDIPPGSHTCTVGGSSASCGVGFIADGAWTKYVACADTGGNQQDNESNTIAYFGVDTAPPTSTILYPLMSMWLNNDFTAFVTDVDTSGGPEYSGVTDCYWSFKDLITVAAGNASRSGKDSPFDVKVGPGGNCTSQGADRCNITAWCVDGAGNVGT